MTYKNFTVAEASKFLETDNSNVYKLINNGILNPIQKDPVLLSEIQLFSYLNTRVPTHLKVYYSDEQVA
jgi:hypothetical protein|tara:strand:+ start:209 stop:415 length:207 start_codon:yes stop_codon:yes gene_type:complete